MLCVEMDADVADAARNFLGVDFRLLANPDDAFDVFNERSTLNDDRLSAARGSGFGLVIEDIADFLDRDECAGSFDVVLLDAYDGEGRVPAHLRDPENKFVRKCWVPSVPIAGASSRTSGTARTGRSSVGSGGSSRSFRRQLAAGGRVGEGGRHGERAGEQRGGAGGERCGGGGAWRAGRCEGRWSRS